MATFVLGFIILVVMAVFFVSIFLIDKDNREKIFNISFLVGYIGSVPAAYFLGWWGVPVGILFIFICIICGAIAESIIG